MYLCGYLNIEPAKDNGEKEDVLDIRAPELCERTLKRLSLKLTNDKYRDEFITFAGQYARTLEDEIIRYQMNNENDQVAPMNYSFANGGDYYSDGGYAGNVVYQSLIIYANVRYSTGGCS